MEQTLNYYTIVLRRALGSEGELEKVALLHRNISAGLIGEKRLIFALNELQFPHTFIHNFISWNQVGHSIQIDVIFICKHFVLIFEVKNITGQIDFDEARRQFIRKTVDGRMESFMNPVDQVLRHKHFLDSILVRSSLDIPVEAAVVIANHSAIIGNISSEVPIFNVAGTRHIISELCKKYAHVNLNIHHVRELIMQHYVERAPILPTGNFTLRDGILCNTCNSVMQHTVNGFKCSRCNHYDRHDESLRQSLWEYSVLHSSTITNREFRRFAGVSCSSTAKKMLRRLELPLHGKKRGAYYSLNHLKNLL